MKFWQLTLDMWFFILTSAIFVLKCAVREMIFTVLIYFMYAYVWDCNWMIYEYENVIKYVYDWFILWKKVYSELL